MLTRIVPVKIGYLYRVNSILYRVNSRSGFMLLLQSDCILYSGFLGVNHEYRHSTLSVTVNVCHTLLWINNDTDFANTNIVSGGATRGVTVSMSAFLACHQCYCVGSSLTLGLNLRAVVCGIF